MHTDVTYCILFLGFRSQICLARVIDCDEPIRNRSLQYIKSGPNPKESSWTLGNMHQEHLQGKKEKIKTRKYFHNPTSSIAAHEAKKTWDGCLSPKKYPPATRVKAL